MTNEIIALNKDSFDDVINNDATIVVCFSAKWCKPCKGFSETFASVAADFPKVKFATIDSEEEPELTKSFNVRSVPTIIIVRERVALYMESGVVSFDELKSIVQQAVEIDMASAHKKIAKDFIK